MGEISVFKWKGQEVPAQIGQLYRAILSLWAQNNKSKWGGISWPFYTSK